MLVLLESEHMKFRLLVKSKIVDEPMTHLIQF